MAEGDQEVAWETIPAEARTLQGRPSSTIELRARGGGLDGLPLVDAAVDHGLTLFETLGEGGMGVVRRATQRSMGREVAVKGLRGPSADPELARKLLQEAWTTGRLEHPNVIPIYDIAMGDQGPLVVLKRVQGEAWAKLLREPEVLAQFVDGEDDLDRHLRVLDQVCRALHFAHSRGIVHLDVKPSNVMLGLHGEVYLVDWGIAMSLADDGTGQVHLAAEHRGIVGTPHYLAPEMLEGEGTNLGPHTDVYLVGATLFEIVAGHPPHQGESLMEVFHAVLKRDPELPPDAPAELAAICRKAMARKPGDRHDSAEAIRRELQAFARHRESARIADRATERLRELERALDAGSIDDRDRQSAFAQARFGFEQALASWPENEAARSGLARAFETMIELELRGGDPHVSAALAREAPSLPSALRARVEEAVARRQRSLDELASRRRDQDLRIGQRTRVFVLSVLGLLWLVSPVLEHFQAPSRARDEAYLLYGGLPLLSLVLLTGLTIWARESLGATRANRITVAAVFLGVVGQVAMTAACALLGLPPIVVIALIHLPWAMGAAVVAIAVDRRTSLLPLLYLGGFFAALVWPEGTFIVATFSALSLLLHCAILWRPVRLRGPIPEPSHHD